MDIGQVNAIRPVPPIRSSSPVSGNGTDGNTDLSGIFASEFRDQQRDDSYSPSRKASRGLEDEDSEEDAADDQPTREQKSALEENSISFFA
jgi:hypothetical protein